MSDVTVETLLEHADWIDGCGHGLGPGEALRAEAARLEAESARDEEAERIAEALVEAYYTELGISGVVVDGKVQWNPAGLNYPAWMAVARAAFQLAADGRLLTEGGTVLDAGQWAMVRTLIEASHRKPEVQRAADRLRDEFKVGRCRCGGLIAEPSPGCEWHSAREVTPPAASVPNSGPDGTPENPWPTWQDAPEGAVYRGTHRDGSPTESRWMNRGGECWVVDGLAATHPESYRLVNSFAPFVRVDGDKA